MCNYISIIDSLNSRLLYIEENLNSLTTEEYACTGSFSGSTSNYTPLTKYVTFEKAFAEPPSVNAWLTSNEDMKFGAVTVYNITTVGFNVSVAFNGGGARSCSIAWSAVGLVRKDI